MLKDITKLVLLGLAAMLATAACSSEREPPRGLAERCEKDLSQHISTLESVQKEAIALYAERRLSTVRARWPDLSRRIDAATATGGRFIDRCKGWYPETAEAVRQGLTPVITAAVLIEMRLNP